MSNTKEVKKAIKILISSGTKKKKYYYPALQHRISR